MSNDGGISAGNILHLLGTSALVATDDHGSEAGARPDNLRRLILNNDPVWTRPVYLRRLILNNDPVWTRPVYRCLCRFGNMHFVKFQSFYFL
jgi:hypothetical protein